MNELLLKKKTSSRYLKSWLNVIVFLNLYILIYLTMYRIAFIFDWILVYGEASNQIRRIFVQEYKIVCQAGVNDYNWI